jgi:hypothetical protein
LSISLATAIGQRLWLTPYWPVPVASPNVEGINLEGAFVKYDTTGIVVNDFLQTTNTRIYAAGDVCLDRKFAHAAEASSPTLAPGSRR